MSKEAQSRPFKDTQHAYRQTVDDLIKSHPPIATNDELIWEASRSGYIGGVPGSTSISARRTSTKGHPQEAIIPLSVPIDKERLPKNLKTHNMTQIYLYGDETHEEVGNMFGVTRENVRQSTRLATKNITALASQVNYDFDSLRFRKPLSDRSRDRISLKKGGVSLKILSAVENGSTYEELKEKGFNSTQINSARTNLSKRDARVAVPMNSDGNRDWQPTMAVLEDPLTDRLVVRELISDITRGIYAYYSKDLPGQEAVLIDILGIARKAGLHPRVINQDVTFIADYLSAKCVPIGHVEAEVKSGKQKGIKKYNFTTANFVDEAIVLLQSAQGERFEQMRTTPVVAIGPAPEKIPTTNDLVGTRKNQEYKAVLALLESYAITRPSKLFALGFSSVTDLVGQHPPVTVFSLGGRGTFVEISKAEELRQYLEERLKEIRIKRPKSDNEKSIRCP